MSDKNTLFEKIKQYENEGYDRRFQLTPKSLKCIETGQFYDPENFTIVAAHRFDGMTSAGDESVLYVIEADNSQMKGLLIDAYGTYSDSLSFEMIEKLKYDPTANQ